MSTASAQPDVIYFNIGRVWTMALTTLIEMTRQKVFYFMIVFGLLMIGAASFFSIFFCFCPPIMCATYGIFNVTSLHILEVH